MNYSKLLSLLVTVLVVCSVGFVVADQAKEAGDKAHWGVAAIRSNGDIDTDGGVVATGSLTADVVGSVSGATSLGLTGGAFSIQNTTQLVFIVTGVATNIIDADITTP